MMDGTLPQSAPPKAPLAKNGEKMNVALISMPTLTASVPSPIVVPPS